jgi:hypothetical protein
MNHKRYKEWLQLSFVDELTDEEKGLLRTHLEQCDECRAEFHELQQLMTYLGESGAGEPSGQLLREARQSLRDALSKESLTESTLTRTTQGVAPSVSSSRGGFRSTRSPGFAGAGWMGWLGGFRLALSGAAAMAIGLFIGYLAFGRGAIPSHAPGAYEEGITDQELGRPGISNIRFLDWGTGDGQIEIQYDLVRPVRLRASLDDDRVQRMLTRALQTEDNAGVRLKAIRALDATATHAYDADIKLALISALKTDPNPGVRKQSLRALQNVPFDEDIKEVCLFVLQNDDNPGMRVASINLLSGATLEGHVMGKEVYEVLNATLEQEDDPLLRARSTVFIEEVNDE